MQPNTPDIKELRAIVEWANLTSDVQELSIRYHGVEVFLSRDQQARHRNGHVSHAPVPAPEAAHIAAPASAAPAPAPAPAAAAPIVAPVADAAPPAPHGADAELAANEVLVKAPMVGTFYAAPKPGDPPFVKVGDAVTESSVVGIVEVMKLMNNLEAKAEGTVARILVENEQPVQYGQPLMVITRNA